MVANLYSLPEDNNQNAGERLVETVYAQLHQDILFGIYEPSSKLKFDGLRRRYEASANTIREALARLVVEGLVETEGQRGASVVPITMEGLHDITETRILLECQAARLSLAVADLQWEGEVMAAHYKLAKAEELAFEDHDQYRNLLERYDCDFHRTIISGCQSHWILRFHAVMYDHMLRYRSQALKTIDEAQRTEMLFRAQSDHVMLRDAALNKDANQVVEYLQIHIRKGKEFAQQSTISSS
ncbi:MAG: GntR family transcriptional regulator [Chloroflexota bacterium]